MTARWPSSMPKPLRDGFSQVFLDTRLRRNADFGPPSYRSRFSRLLHATSMTFEVDRDTLEEFRVFYTEDLRMGSLPFIMPDPLTDGWPLTDTDGDGLLLPDGSELLAGVDNLVTIGDQPPQITPIGNRFRISLQVVKLP